jgi:protein-ribulosamine 3-kinase
MLAGEIQSSIEAAVSAATGRLFRIEFIQPASGGCIHRSFRIEGHNARYFVKTNSAEFADAFAAEADGLEALAAAGVSAPRPVTHGCAGTHSWLAMQFLPLVDAGNYAALGRTVAALHSVRGERYGWRRDNFIGATPQRNGSSKSWSGFWREQRLLPQLELAKKNGFGKSLARKGEQLAIVLPQLLSGHEPAASLLHGDLWNGNAGFLENGAPVLFDPAVFYGDREADIAMTELFGGFPLAFYEAYLGVAPLDAGYARRKTLYNLYHVLNHANLFGGGYVARAEQMMNQLLAETKA